MLDFQHVSFLNQSASNVTGAENRGQISDFLTPPPVKNKGGMGKMSESVFHATPGPNH